MRPEELPVPGATPNLPPDTVALRTQVRTKCIDSTLSFLHDSGVLHNVRGLENVNPNQIKELGGGYNGATWWIGVPGDEIVLKFQKRRCEIEAEWLDTYRQQGVPVPRVMKIGVVPNQTDTDSKIPIQFLALEAVMGPDERRAKTAREVDAGEIPSKEISRLMGQYLAKMHFGATNRKPGDYENAPNEKKFDSWQEYLVSFLNPEYTAEFDVRDSEWIGVISKINSISFPRVGVYLHGDYAFHNVLLRKIKPPEITIIDPNLVIGDFYFDLAKQVSFKELRDAKRKSSRGKGQYVSEWWEQSPLDPGELLEAYRQTSGLRKLDTNRLKANQLIHEIQAYKVRKRFLAGHRLQGHEESIASEMEVRRKSIRDTVNFLKK